MGAAAVSIALAFDVFIAMDRIAGTAWGAGSGAGFFVLTMLFWFGPAFVTKRRKQPMARTKSPKPTPLETQVEQLLTEARAIIPGAQALLGFQLTVTLTRAFQQLPADAKLLHAAALFCVGVAVVLLAPASLHRISFAGEDDPEFLRIASMFVIAAPAPVGSASRSIPTSPQAAPWSLHQERRRWRSRQPSYRSDSGTPFRCRGALPARPHDGDRSSPRSFQGSYRRHRRPRPRRNAG